MSKWIQKVFDEYDMPAGRTPDSFAHKIECIWSGVVVDTYFTDDATEAERVTRASLNEQYDVRVTSGGETKAHQPV